MDVQDESPSLREVMSCYPTGVTIVTGCGDEGEPYGLTVNSFTSVSLDPPLVLVCIAQTSTSHDRLVAATSFAVNILSGDQDKIAIRFASEPSEGRFDEFQWSAGPTSGCPVIDGSLAWLECEVAEVRPGGDHSILLGRVVGSMSSFREALIFHRGQLTSSRP